MSKQCKVIDPGEGCSSVEQELLAKQLVRSLRKANFDLYVQSLVQLVPWIIAFDHTNYARTLKTHLQQKVHIIMIKSPQFKHNLSVRSRQCYQPSRNQKILSVKIVRIWLP